MVVLSMFATLDDLGDVSGRKALVRVDINVPMEGDRVTDTTRMERVAPTILQLADKGASVIVLAHFGRPKGKHGKTTRVKCNRALWCLKLFP